MDFQTLQEEVRIAVADVNIPQFYIARWLNDAQVNLNGRLKLVYREVSSTLNNANGTITLPADWLELGAGRLNIAYSFGPDDVEWVDDQTFDSWKEDTTQPQPDARLGRVFNANIELYPYPAQNTAYLLRYLAVPVTLVNPTDIPEVPVGVHMKLVHYARAMGKYAQGSSEGDRFMALFEQGLPAVQTGQERDMPGPLDIRLEGGYFDSVDYLT